MAVKKDCFVFLRNDVSKNREDMSKLRMYKVTYIDKDDNCSLSEVLSYSIGGETLLSSNPSTAKYNNLVRITEI
jgi:hypothetical protein